MTAGGSVPGPRSGFATRDSGLSAERFGRPHLLVGTLAGLAFAAHGLVYSALSFTLVAIAGVWSLSPAAVSLPLVLFGVGQLLSAVLSGVVADRHGRRRLFPLAVGLCSIGAAIAASSPSFEAFLLAVVIIGVGSGAILPVAGSIVSEFSPAQRRGQLMGWMEVTWSAGWLVSGVVAVLTIDSLGWRAILWFAATPILLAIVSYKLLPESPRFLIAAGRLAEAKALVEKLERQYGLRLPMPAQQLATGQSFRASLAELWRPAFRRRTAMIWLVAAAAMATSQGPSLLLPSLYLGEGVGPERAALTTLLVSLLMLPAALLATWLIERLGRKPLVVAGLGLACAGTVALALGSPHSLALAGGAAMQAGISVAWPAMLAYSTELYPTRIRATGAGSALGFARIVAMVAPMIIGIGMNVSELGRALALVVFSVVLASAVIVTAVIGEETAGRTLEEIGG